MAGGVDFPDGTRYHIYAECTIPCDEPVMKPVPVRANMWLDPDGHRVRKNEIQARAGRGVSVMILGSIYLLCLLVGLIWAVVATIMGGIHTDMGGHDFGDHGFGDHGIGGHGIGDHGTAEGGHGLAGDYSGAEIQFSPLSPVVLATFITAFGAFGLIGLYAMSVAALISIAIAVAGAFIIASAVFYLFAKVFSITQGTSEARQSDLLGTTAEIITPIPEKGLGEVAYVIRGSRYNAPARCESGEALPRFAQVTIVATSGTTLTVRLKDVDPYQ